MHIQIYTVQIMIPEEFPDNAKPTHLKRMGSKEIQ